MKQFLINIPGVIGSGSLCVFSANEKSARKLFRDRLGYGKRLPRGTKVYAKV